jgi:hypothetical protein
LAITQTSQIPVRCNGTTKKFISSEKLYDILFKSLLYLSMCDVTKKLGMN